MRKTVNIQILFFQLSSLSAQFKQESWDLQLGLVTSDIRQDLINLLVPFLTHRFLSKCGLQAKNQLCPQQDINMLQSLTELEILICNIFLKNQIHCRIVACLGSLLGQFYLILATELSHLPSDNSLILYDQSLQLFNCTTTL